jgi:hypothetical protein
MAINARLRAPGTTLSGLQVKQQWDFYDTADPANSGTNASTPPEVVLYSDVILMMPETLTVPAVTTRLTTVAAQLTLGRTIATSLNQNVPPGTIVPLG